MSLWLKYKFEFSNIAPIEQYIKKVAFKNRIENVLEIKDASYELWNKALFEEMNGELLIEDKNIEKIRDSIQEMINPDSLFQKTKGFLEIQGKKISFNSILYNSRKYREIYGDIQIDSTNFSFEDLFLNNSEFKNKILKLIKIDLPHIYLTSCIVGESPDAVNDIRERIFTYHPKSRYFIEDFFSTFKIWSNQIREEEIITDKTKIDYGYYFKQFNTEYLARKIEKDTAFNTYCTNMAKKVGAKVTGGSILLEADTTETFDKLFQMIKDDFNEIKNQWYSDKKLKTALKSWFSGQQELDI